MGFVLGSIDVTLLKCLDIAKLHGSRFEFETASFVWRTIAAICWEL